eukprot:m.689049 g.689049  ORF g.689049 m.689049 type:complete len:229 (+) comp58634_c0_seq62:1572-2258(+)
MRCANHFVMDLLEFVIDSFQRVGFCFCFPFVILIVDQAGDTPLMLTCKPQSFRHPSVSKRLALVQLLLRAGALVGVRNKKGHSAADLADSFRFAPIVDVLKEHEAFLANLGSHTKPALRTPADDASVMKATVETDLLLRWTSRCCASQPVDDTTTILLDLGMAETTESTIEAETEQPTCATEASDSCALRNHSSERAACVDSPSAIPAPLLDLDLSDVEELRAENPAI